MNKAGPIIIIVDDIDDRQLLNAVFTSLQSSNEIFFFSDGQHALEQYDIISKEGFTGN